MIRRSPTRIELKLDDLNDFDYIQKFEKKKNPSGTVVSCSDAQKLVRQERIGLGIGFRPVRASSNVGSQSGSFTTPPAVGAAGAVAADLTVPVTPTNNDTPFEMNVTSSSAAEGSNLMIAEDERPNITTNTSNMSLDESL